MLDWADSRLFGNPAFLASKGGPDNWPSAVKTASVRVIPLLLLLRNPRSKCREYRHSADPRASGPGGAGPAARNCGFASAN